MHITKADPMAYISGSDGGGCASDVIQIPLRSWMKNEEAKEAATFADLEINNTQNNFNDDKKCFKESIIRRTSIAYGIAELLNRSSDGALEGDNIIRIDDFAISVCNRREGSPRSWDDIKGVAMVSSGMSLTIEEPSYLRGLLEGESGCDGQMGRCLEVELASDSKTCGAAAALDNVEQSAGMTVADCKRCHLFSRLLYELFTHELISDEDALADTSSTKLPAQKRARKSNVVSSRKNLMLTRAEGDFDSAGIPFQIPSIVHMQEQGIPASICLMTQNLLECALRGDGNYGQLRNAYESFGVVCEDLHLLLLDPDRFLFDPQNRDSFDMQLLYRTDKLYGREKEETLITDAFCRVSRGMSEAFFIGGFSGSGKSMLVNSLRDQVNVVGGYTIKHKFDTMSQEKPLSGVITAFNQVCQMIKDKARPLIAKKLGDEFGVDFSLLVRLLPSVSVLFPEFDNSAMRVEAGEAMNARSVCFTLLRFVRVVSSPRDPIMLFLDDIQWADNSAFDVIHTILSDTMGSCVFFVGTYRDNEVQVDHPVFHLIEKLESSNVHTSKMHLTGLNQEDINTMISDALCIYPRICESLSDILFQKTKGNPFFLLEFMQSLKSRGLLRYNSHQKRWMWNEDIIRAEDITDNVLHLLSSKMNSLSDDVQMTLKVIASFGSSINETVIDYLSDSASVEYAGIRNGLEGALSDGFVLKDGAGRLQFVHDKVREAAYNLLPGNDKKKFHYQLGTVLHAACGGNDAEDTIFNIASQINHGKEWILKDKVLSISIAELNMKAGKSALDGCDHKTAYSFLKFAVSLLPADSWESHYDLSLRVNFLTSSAANSCCQYDEAGQLLRRGLANTRCLEDQLPSHLLLSQILRAQGKVNDVYDTCRSILMKLGETIPEKTLSIDQSSKMIVETLKMYEEVGGKWLRQETGDKTLNTTLQFYSAIAFVSFLCKSYSMAVYYTCKAVQLSLHRGLCEHSLVNIVQFTSIATTDDNAEPCYRIAKNALSLRERFDMAVLVPEIYVNFYGRIAWGFEPFQVCTNNLRQGFEAGLSSGHVGIGLDCSFHAIKFAMVSGANLKSILKEIDYYLLRLKIYKNAHIKNPFLIYRETVSLLIDNGEATGIEEKAVLGDSNDNENNVYAALLFYHQAIRAYWSGYADQCRYYCEKHLSISSQEVRFIRTQVEFYHGLNSIVKLRVRYSAKVKDAVYNSMRVMRKIAMNSDWNYKNKLFLLEAELQSLNGSYCAAMSLYDASIVSARNSGFIHEQGLACEKAGFHFKAHDAYSAFEYFKQALACYEEWGSSTKVAAIQAELNTFRHANR